MSGTGGILSTNQRREPPGLLPFNGADNGLAIDNVSGKVVLGEDEASSSAALLGPRQIPMNTFSLGFFLDVATNERLFLNENGAAINVELGANPNAVVPFLFHSTMNAQPFETQIDNDGAGPGTEARHEMSAGGNVAVGHVGAMVDSVIFGDTAFLRGVNSDLSLITDQPGHNILMYVNNVEVEKFTSSARTAHIPDHIVFDGVNEMQSAADNNVNTGWDFKTAAGVEKGFLHFNGNQGYIRFGGESGGYHPELWSDGKKRLDIAAAGSFSFFNDVAATVLEVTQIGNMAITGAISTANPSGGSANWKLGTVRAGVVAFDNTRSVQVDVGGTLVNFLVST